MCSDMVYDSNRKSSTALSFLATLAAVPWKFHAAAEECVLVWLADTVLVRVQTVDGSTGRQCSISMFERPCLQEVFVAACRVLAPVSRHRSGAWTVVLETVRPPGVRGDVHGGGLCVL